MTKANSNGNGDLQEIDEQSPELRRALQVWTNAQLISRSMLANRLGTQFDGARDLYKTFGYPQQPGYQDFRNLYDRQGMATRAVEKFVDDTWNKAPILIDGDGRSDNLSEKATPFLKEWVALNERLQVIQILRQADIMLGFSRYSVVFLGAPGIDFSMPAGNDGLFYLMAFDENQATLGEYITDTTSEKFAMPNSYTIAFNSVDSGAPMPGGNSVHHSRVIHASENKLGSRLYGRPRLKNLINRLYDLEKVVGGGAEAAWLAVYKGILFSAREGAEIPSTGSPEASRLDEQMNALMHRIQRYAVVSDVDVHDLGVESVSISDIFGVVVSDAAATLGIPQRIWLGSERGELASTQDKEEWNGVIRSRRTHHAEPELLHPFINWCILHKVISPPASGKFLTEWEDVYPMSKAEKAGYGAQLAAGASTITGGVPDEALSVNEWRQASGLPPLNAEQVQEIEERQAEREAEAQEAQEQFEQGEAAKEGLGKMENTKPRGFSANVANALHKLGDLFEIKKNSFDDHRGRPGERGGSLPRDAGAGGAVTDGTEDFSNLKTMPDNFKGAPISRWKKGRNGVIAITDSQGIGVNTQSYAWKDMAAYQQKAFDVGWQSTPHPNHVIAHEYAHYWGANNNPRYEGLRSYFGSHNPEFKRVASEVSQYATTNGVEFLSETYAGLNFGKTYSAEVMTMYKGYGGLIP